MCGGGVYYAVDKEKIKEIKLKRPFFDSCRFFLLIFSKQKHDKKVKGQCQCQNKTFILNTICRA